MSDFDHRPPSLLLEVNEALRPLVSPRKIPALLTGMVRRYFIVDRCLYLHGSNSLLEVRGAVPQELTPISAWPSSVVDILCRGILRKADVVNGPDSDLSFIEWCQERDIASLLSVPVKESGGAVWVLYIADNRPRAWTDADVRTLEEVAVLGTALYAQKAAEVALRGGDKRRSGTAESPGDRRFVDFLAKLIHDLPASLTPLTGALQLADQVAGEEEQARIRTLMARQLRQLVKRVDELAQLVHLLRRSLPLDKQWIELTDAVRAALEAAQPQGGGSAPSFDLRHPDESLPVEADYRWLVRAFAAIFETAPGMASVVDPVSVRLARENRSAVVKIFMGKTVVSPSGNHPAAFGTGLDIARAILEMHGGTIRTDDGGRGGGGVTVVLPLDPEDTGRS